MLQMRRVDECLLLPLEDCHVRSLRDDAKL